MRSGGGTALSRLWISIILIGIILFGLSLSIWRVWQVNQRMRDALLEEATLISWAIRADAVAGVQCSEADLGTPGYEAIKTQLVESRNLYPYIRFIYLMRQRADGAVVFVADSEPSTSADYSPPGQTYDEASPILLDVFDRRESATEGPMRDRWGMWYSAFVPLFDPYSDEVSSVLGVDINVTAWRADVMRSVFPPVVATMVMLALAGVFIRLRRLAYDGLRPRVSRWWEIAVSASFGLVLTVSFALAVNENESWKNHLAFRRVVTVQASSLQQILFRIGENYLEGIARFFEGSDFVDRREFGDYTGYLLNRPYASSWSWIPLVKAENKRAFEIALQEAGVEDYTVWEGDPRNGRQAAGARPVHYPVCYIEPQAEHRAWLGYDVGSDPEHRAAIDYAKRNRILSASPARSVPALGPGKYVVAFRPVFNRSEPERLSGLAATVLDMDLLLARALSRGTANGASIAHIELYELIPGRPPEFLASNGPERDGRLFSKIQHRKGPSGLKSFSAPAYAFGRVYAVLAEPAAGFNRLYPPREGVRAGAVGLLVTGLITALIGLLTNRRARLEQQVAERTAALRKSEESYRGLFNAIQQSIYIQDERGCFVDVNDGAVARYGYTREEFIGRSPDFVAAPEKNDMNQVQASFVRAWNGGTEHFEFWGLTKSGEVFPKEVWLCKGTYMGKDVVIAVSTDITERKQAEGENERLQAQLLQSQKMESIGRLAGGVAHDFNNMLQAIIGNTSLAKQEIAASHPVAEYLSEIENSAHRSARLTRQLLAFASKQTIQPRILDLNDTVGGMLKMLRRLIGEDIQLSWNPGPNLWPVKIDPGQIDQILANLAVNARDAISGAGSIVIETENFSCEPERCRHNCIRCAPCQYVVISVTDNGSGMSDDVRAHLFEPFFTTKEPGKGTGLGLATVFGIVQQNNGVIEVDSAPGRGSTFRILLPKIDVEFPVATASPIQDTLSGRETILLVEDEAVILQVGMISLQRLGYSVLVASTPDIALRAAREYDGIIHLLITDVILPGVNGPELAQQIARIKPGIACLFMSGYTADVISDRSVLDESVNFIQKPFTIPDLAAKIRSVLDFV